MIFQCFFQKVGLSRGYLEYLDVHLTYLTEKNVAGSQE